MLPHNLEMILIRLCTAWRGRPFRYGLNFLVVAAVVYFGFTAWNSLQQISRAPVAKNKMVQKHNSTDSADNRQQYGLDDYRVIIERNLFGGSAYKQESEEDEQEISLKEMPLAMKDLNLRLVGTVLKDNSSNIAVIEDRKKGKQFLLRQGDQIKKVTIKKVLRNNVVIQTTQGEKVLTMDPREFEEPEKEGSRPRPSVPAGPSNETQGNRRVSRSSMANSLQDMASFMRNVRIEPYFENGQPKGFRINDINNQSIYSRIGLQEGDILLSVNNEPMNNPVQVMSLFDQLKNEERVSLQIMRDNEKQTIDIDLTQ